MQTHLTSVWSLLPRSQKVWNLGFNIDTLTPFRLFLGKGGTANVKLHRCHHYCDTVLHWLWLLGAHSGGEQELWWHPRVPHERGGTEGHHRHGQPRHRPGGLHHLHPPPHCCGYSCFLQVSREYSGDSEWWKFAYLSCISSPLISWWVSFNSEIELLLKSVAFMTELLLPPHNTFNCSSLKLIHVSKFPNPMHSWCLLQLTMI